MIRVSQVQAIAIMYGIKPATLRQWVRRGHVVRGPDGRITPESLARHTDKRPA